MTLWLVPHSCTVKCGSARTLLAVRAIGLSPGGLSLVMGAITTGLIVQWLVDPENAAHPEDVARGIREIARQLESAAPTTLGE